MLCRTGWLHAGRHLFENWARLRRFFLSPPSQCAGTLSRRNLFRERARYTATIIKFYLYSILSGRMDGRRAPKKGLRAYDSVEFFTVPTCISRKRPKSHQILDLFHLCIISLYYWFIRYRKKNTDWKFSIGGIVKTTYIGIFVL